MINDARSAEHEDDPATRAREIKAHARVLGFDAVGIAPAVALDAERSRLEEWLARGFHAGMEWMAPNPDYPDNIARRTDPRLLLPSARSVVVVALNYHTPHEHDGDETRGKISRYAWGDDYHDVVGDKLRLLLAWITARWAGTEGKVCCDIQPMMDKAWAVRAGLGWIGKHSNLITRTRGSWVFLGELILNLELAHDTQIEPDRCGSCTLCIEACPTGAITEPRVVDARRCISYHTIESRAAGVPSHVAENLNGWLYGCDICQDVCPWNRFEQSTDEDRFEPRADETSLALDDVLAMTPEEYAARFHRSPIKRAKLTGLQRNARTLREVGDAGDG